MPYHPLSIGTKVRAVPSVMVDAGLCVDDIGTIIKDLGFDNVHNEIYRHQQGLETARFYRVCFPRPQFPWNIVFTLCEDEIEPLD